MIKVAIAALSPAQLVFSRLVLGAAVLASLAIARGVTLRMSRPVWGHITVAAVFGNVAPYLLLSYGERSTGANIAGVLVGGTPLLTLLLATVALRDEKATRRRFLCFLIGFVGVTIVIAPWHDQLGSLGARVACFGAAVSYAAGYVYVRKFLSSTGVPPLTFATNQLVAAAVLMAFIVPFVGWRTPALSWKVVLSVVLLGALSTGLANILYFQLIENVGATMASAVDYLVPVFAVIFSVILIGERLSWNIIVGGLVVLLAMGLAEGKLRRRRKDPILAGGPPAEPVRS
jgi:drug/metabolite transporter (DMT)-like permease